jgi:hypothetical protein
MYVAVSPGASSLGSIGWDRVVLKYSSVQQVDIFSRPLAVAYLPPSSFIQLVQHAYMVPEVSFPRVD